ncbi:MAG TPA: DUF4397 domain-containing protein, partial [Saprospiraceae bacterium]|nr:DUF4397 domain-containing protein [Saprospiraceae bacterium]
VVFATSVPNASPSHQLRLLRPDGSVTLLSQPRRTNLQVVHNSPSARMDVYYGGHLVANNFDFRYFSNIEVYSDRPATLSIAPDTSTSVKSAVVAFPIALEQGKNTAAYIDGVLGDTATPLALYTREIGFGPLTNDIELTLHHGAPGAPAIDVAVEGMGNVYTDLAYGENSGSIYLPPGVYQIKVKKAGTEQVVGEFEADLSQLAPIKAANVFASGFTDKNPVFGLWYTSLDYNTPPAGQLAFEFPRKVAFTKAQFIHNAASPTVDVYINGGQAFDNVAYRSASGFLDIPAGLPLSIAFAPENSVSAAEAFATFDVVLDQSKTYVITVSGIVGSTATPFTLLVHDAALLESPDPAQVAVAVLHGSTDAPAVDIDAVFVAHDVVSDLAYGAYTDYLTLPPDVYDLAIRASGSPDVLAMYRADLSGLAGVAATVFASGTLGGSPAFGLFAALADGTVTQLPLTPTARVQLIHNAPDPTVDVYAGNTRLLDDFAFRSATPFLSLPADRPIRLGMAPAGSASAADTLAGFGINLATDETYALFANGIVGNPSTPFTLLPDAAREAAADTSKVEVALLHGAPGAPAVDIDLLSGNMLLGTVPDLAYGEFISYLALDPADYRIRIRPNGSPLAVATYIADLSTWKGRAARIFASGILGGMPAFGLFAALPDGTVIEFPVLPPPPSARVQIIHNAADPTVDIYADGLLLLDDFPYRTATSFISLPAELPLSIALAPANSSSVADAIAVFPLNLEKDKRYVVVASGTVGSTATPFTLLVNDQALESAQTAGEVAVSVLHGSTDAPAVDVDALFDTDNLVQNLAYGQFSVDYLSLLPQVYDLALRATGSPDVLASYRADLSALAGQALTVFASGALGGTPGFGLFAALSNGAVVELPLTPTARVQLIHNSPDPTVDVYAGNTRLLDDFAFRKATPFVTLPADRPIAFAVAGENSTSPADALATFPLTFAPGLTY